MTISAEEKEKLMSNAREEFDTGWKAGVATCDGRMIVDSRKEINEIYIACDAIIKTVSNNKKDEIKFFRDLDAIMVKYTPLKFDGVKHNIAKNEGWENFWTFTGDRIELLASSNPQYAEKPINSAYFAGVFEGLRWIRSLKQKGE